MHSTPVQLGSDLQMPAMFSVDGKFKMIVDFHLSLYLSTSGFSHQKVKIPATVYVVQFIFFAVQWPT